MHAFEGITEACCDALCRCLSRLPARWHALHGAVRHNASTASTGADGPLHSRAHCPNCTQRPHLGAGGGRGPLGPRLQREVGHVTWCATVPHSHTHRDYARTYATLATGLPVLARCLVRVSVGVAPSRF